MGHRSLQRREPLHLHAAARRRRRLLHQSDACRLADPADGGRCDLPDRDHPQHRSDGGLCRVRRGSAGPAAVRPPRSCAPAPRRGQSGYHPRHGGAWLAPENDGRRAHASRNRLIDLLEKAEVETDPRAVRRRRLLSVVVVGGGYSGAEVGLWRNQGSAHSLRGSLLPDPAAERHTGVTPRRPRPDPVGVADHAVGVRDDQDGQGRHRHRVRRPGPGGDRPRRMSERWPGDLGQRRRLHDRHHGPARLASAGSACRWSAIA